MLHPKCRNPRHLIPPCIPRVAMGLDRLALPMGRQRRPLYF